MVADTASRNNSVGERCHLAAAANAFAAADEVRFKPDCRCEGKSV